MRDEKEGRKKQARSMYSYETASVYQERVVNLMLHIRELSGQLSHQNRYLQTHVYAEARVKRQIKFHCMFITNCSPV